MKKVRTSDVKIKTCWQIKVNILRSPTEYSQNRLVLLRSKMKDFQQYTKTRKSVKDCGTILIVDECRKLKEKETNRKPKVNETNEEKKI